MYLRPRFLEELHAIREEMSRECDYDMDLFVQFICNQQFDQQGLTHTIRSIQQTAHPNVESSKGVISSDDLTGCTKKEKAE